jgi:glycosyltransferase involved in cell wall biosynthesis
MKIVLAQDSFTQIGGAERLLAAVHEIYPSAPVYTTVLDRRLATEFKGWKIITSKLQGIYDKYPRFQHLFPLVPIVLRFLKVEPADVLFSFSSSYIKGVRKPAAAVHINYCHTPTRFIWTDADYAVGEVHPLLRPLARLYFVWLRRWDKRSAAGVDYFIANSKEVQTRIKNIYGRDSQIIYPFVDTNFWRPTRTKQDYFLIGGRLQPHKNNEAVLQLFNKNGLPLHVFGTGRQEPYLRSIAKSNIKFLGRISDEQLRDEYSGAQALIYPPYEDFGLMSVEAAACGTPTIGLGQAGILETVVPGKTGELFPEASEAEIGKIVSVWNGSRYSQGDLVAHAQSFNKEKFQKQIKDFVEAHENSN